MSHLEPGGLGGHGWFGPATRLGLECGHSLEETPVR